jgi:transcriptional regulator with XRE-family HTH domain
MVEPRDLGKAIQRLRGDRTQKVCAEKVGLSPSSWSLYESGDRVPRKGMRERIARGLGVELRVLDDTAWQMRNERLASEAGPKTGLAGAEAARDARQHAIDEHVNGVAHHLRELALLLSKRPSPL